MPSSAYHIRGKVTLLLLFLTTAALKVAAQGIVTIDSKFFHADSIKKIIVVNAPINQLNAAFAPDSLRALASKGHRYTLTRPVAKVSTTLSYQATYRAATYHVYFTRVPVLQLSTRYQIMDSPSVYANLVLADTTGILAQSATGIEIRGAFSQSYPKKSYELSLWADTLGATDRDLSLLGMRTDNKWNLQAMYNDQLRLRLKVANELWQDVHQIYYKAQEPNAKNGIALAYTEVFINDSYQGIYTLTERIDRKQLKLKKYANGLAGELYKGASAGVATLFASAPAFDNTSPYWGGFEYKEPSELIDWTNLNSFVNFVATSSNADFYSQYKSRFNFDNAVDYFIFLNLLRAADNTGKNVYIAKYKAGEPYYYAPWDLDGVLGNSWNGSNDDTTNDLLTNGFYDRLLADNSATGFRAALTSRWAGLRRSVLTQAYITAKIKTNNDYLLRSNVYEREQLAWPAYQYTAAQLTYPTNWLGSRLSYLDSVFNPATLLASADAKAAAPFQLYPNPASDYLCVSADAFPCELTIQKANGETVARATLTSANNRFSLSNLPKGLYMASLKNPATTVVRKLVVQ
ncbi:MAG: T9SS type A sorting domain-containing protein [Hymenobacter sp.]|nr:MAG: T9SS type A sorting domain-containing protein [Hymenobacter sp.]